MEEAGVDEVSAVAAVAEASAVGDTVLAVVAAASAVEDAASVVVDSAEDLAAAGDSPVAVASWATEGDS